MRWKKIACCSFSRGAEREADVGLKTEPIKNDQFVNKKANEKPLFIARVQRSAIYCYNNYFFL
jgi:hypothetical protein